MKQQLSWLARRRCNYKQRMSKNALEEGGLCLSAAGPESKEGASIGDD